MLLGVALADLIPDTYELVGGRAGALWIAIGFLVLYLVESLTGGHTHHHEPHEHHTTAPCVPTHSVAPFLLGVGLHNFADGVVVAASHSVSEAAAMGVAGGILVHQIPVGLSFAAVLLASGIMRSHMYRNALLIAMLIPVGAAVVLVVPNLAQTTLGALIGLSSGALLYIATGHLLPEAQSEERRPLAAASFALALVITICAISSFRTSSLDHHNFDSAPSAHSQASNT